MLFDTSREGLLFDTPREGFLYSNTNDSGDWITRCCEICPMYCRVFSNIAGLSPLCASSNPPTQVMTISNVSRYCQMSTGGQNHPHLRTTALKGNCKLIIRNHSMG